MKQPSYEEKRDRAFAEHTAVEKVLQKDRAPKGAKVYIQKRKADLKRVRGY